jgi:hypothetical protein
MAQLTIDDIEYDMDALSESAKGTVNSLQYLEGQIRNLSDELAVYRAAKLQYISGLKDEIEKSGIQPVTTDEDLIEAEEVL